MAELASPCLMLCGVLCGDRKHKEPCACGRLQLTQIVPFLQEHTTHTAKTREPHIMRAKLCALLPEVREATGQTTESIPSLRPACPTGSLLTADGGQGTEGGVSAWAHDLFQTKLLPSQGQGQERGLL